jgi:hypothetical protein
MKCPENSSPWFVWFDWYGVTVRFDNKRNLCICNPGYIGNVVVTNEYGQILSIPPCSKCGEGATSLFNGAYDVFGNVPGQSKCACSEGYYSNDGYEPTGGCLKCPEGTT